MSKERSRRRQARKPMRRAYAEYSKSGTRLSRLFQPEVRRGPLTDISKNGVQFRTTELLKQEEVIFMTLRFSNLREPVELKGEVCWSREEKKVGIENYTHVVGVRFVEFTPHGWDIIAAVMKD